MIAFITVFLGLITGIKPVELTVSGDVAEIEVRLDGELVGLLREEPWKLDCDFGRELATHQLVAVARGPRGRELARLEQLINVPRPHADTQILLEDWHAGRPRSARLLWQTVELTEPSAVSITLDGKVIAERHLERYDLPDLDPETVHLLSARMRFPQRGTNATTAHKETSSKVPDSVLSSAEVVFGGVFGDSTETELTAVPLWIADRKPRRVDQLQGRLTKAGEALRVVAVDDGPAEVVIVRDHRAITQLKWLGSDYHFRQGKYQYLALAKDDAMLVMSPRSYLACHPDTGYAVFPVSPPITHRDVSLPWTLGTVKFERRPVMPQLLTDAVAAAGLRAAASQRRRAVVLALSECAGVSGQWSSQGVRRFLAQLQVPFSVWLVEPPPAGTPVPAAGSFCDGAQPIFDLVKYQAAIKRLRRELLDQQIAWVEGRHLKREITLVGKEPGVRLLELEHPEDTR